MSTTPEAVGPRHPQPAESIHDQRERPAQRWWERARDGAADLGARWAFLAPGVVYLAIRLFGLLVLSWLSAANDETLRDNLRAWDGEWYLEIAAHGYGGVSDSMVDGYGHRSPETPLAFFPGYPVLVRLVRSFPGFGLDGAATTVSLIAGIVAAYGLARIGRSVGGTRGVGLFLVALFAASPMSVTLSMAYSEALFCALAVWALVGVLERNWALAGLCCAASGLVRPTAAALIGVVGLAALVALFRREDGWRPLLGAVLAPAGMVLYVGWVAVQTGELGGYFALQQRGWSSAFDGGVATGKFMLETLSENKSVLETFTVWIVLAALVLLVLCVRARMPWPLVLFAFAVLAMDLGSDGLMYSKVRLLLPAFPLLIPVAIGLANRRTTTAVCSTVLIVCFGAWFGAYALTAWSYAI
ncbi:MULTISPECIES: hypothetical protein [unclassified Saccharopolyspora]|uniref:hypothetical protein n=1 Tax=unclassified Saccharopolyspora TaxID=2646250 RepID=UPI001CD56F19|nr:MULTISPECIES: hypothetical protein [unclassified Saccharopolyspora]MCA1192038.1 hypothetical protein [Saccharopolyspora sp. 6V]MCA1226168.1 hypothetical protein [Saccharopolyspora sp. 6M]MCA1281446.1 hypothetical protein [Saccharopolyspora sp. 7B]